MNKKYQDFFMLRRSLLMLVFLMLFNVIPGFAQQDTATVKLKKNNISPVLLPYNNPMVRGDDQTEAIQQKPVNHDKDHFKRDVMARITRTYKTQVKAMEAELQNDPLSTEKYITDAIKSLQDMLETYPEVQSNDRFSELYRTVMTEYRKFYGVTDSVQRQKGKIFAIQKELFSNKDDWMKGHYKLPDNITNTKTEVPLVQNRQVNRHLIYFTQKRRNVMRHWLKRSKTYFPMMKRIFREEGVPTELVHLAMIESGLNAHARSWASAVGMWQFIQSTGAMYGLKVNWWVDERKNPVKATRAAARHLRDLHNIWDNWYLAIADYNISPRGLKRAIREAGGTKNYWAAYKYLPRETQGYIPAFIAVTMIDRNPTKFGFQEHYKAERYNYQVYDVAPMMSLKTLAKAAGISTNELKNYNPELLRWATPPGGKYPLKLPDGTKKQFAANYESLPKSKRGKNVVMHTVHQGENLGYIARKYGTSVRALYNTNKNLSSTIYPGQKIVVPLAPGSRQQIAINHPTNQPRGKRSSRSSSSSSGSKSHSRSHSNKDKLYYKVKSGDTIGGIAEWYDTRASHIRSWNHTSNVIHPGDKLVIYVPDSKTSYYRQINNMSRSKKQKIEREQRAGKDVTKAYLATADNSSGGAVHYTVHSHDTLIEIAKSFGVSVSKIKRINNLNGSRIYAGQKLRIK